MLDNYFMLYLFASRKNSISTLKKSYLAKINAKI